MTKTVEQRERVVIRFAGDSGDGMQLTGDRFTNATAMLGNDLATLPDFPAEIRAPAGTVHGVSAFQIQFASTDITTPGDHADMLVAMNPAALKADLGTVPRAAPSIAQRGRVHAAEHREGRVRRGPDERRHPRRLPGLQGADDLDHRARGRGPRDLEEGGRAREEHVRARTRLVDVRPAHRDHRRRGSRRSSAARPRSCRRTSRRSTPATRSGRPRSCSRTRSTSRRRRRRPARIATSPASRRSRGAGRRERRRPSCRCSTRATRSRRRPSCCTSCPSTSSSAWSRSRPRTRSRQRTWRSGRRSPVRSAVTGTSGPGLDLKAETIGLAVITELPMIIVDVMRAGPPPGCRRRRSRATCSPRMFGRHGESPIPIVARVLAGRLLRGRRSRRPVSRSSTGRR